MTSTQSGDHSIQQHVTGQHHSKMTRIKIQ